VIPRLKALMDSTPQRKTPAKDLIHPHRDWIASLLEDRQMKAKQIWRLFREKTGLRVGYCTMKRYLRSQFQFGVPAVMVRLEVEPGSQGQVDFGSAGMMFDPATGKRRRAWAFVMTLSYSRHRFVRFVFRQDSPTWIDCFIPRSGDGQLRPVPLGPPCSPHHHGRRFVSEETESQIFNPLYPRGGN
jgi:transposase